MRKRKSHVLVAFIMFAMGLLVVPFLFLFLSAKIAPDALNIQTPESNVSVTVTVTNEPLLPNTVSLSQNYPNPFNSSTIIRYALPEAGRVNLEVYNLLGQKVATLVDEVQQAGYYFYTWNMTDLPSGVYFYRLKTGDFEKRRKMLIIK